MTRQQRDLDRIIAYFKGEVLVLLNETAIEFDRRDLSYEQRQVYNDFTAEFSNKIIGIRMEVEP